MGCHQGMGKSHVFVLWFDWFGIEGCSGQPQRRIFWECPQQEQIVVRGRSVSSQLPGWWSYFLGLACSAPSSSRGYQQLGLCLSPTIIVLGAMFQTFSSVLVRREIQNEIFFLTNTELKTPKTIMVGRGIIWVLLSFDNFPPDST